MNIVRTLFVTWILIESQLYVDAEEPSGFRLSLFDGMTLNGWIIENDCEVDVVDGSIRLKSGLGWLRHETRQRNFELHVEWKPLKPGQYDSGIFIRSKRDGVPFPQTGYQVNLLEGSEGNIPTLPDAKYRPLQGQPQTLIKPAGEWNVFDLRVVGESASLKINGEYAWSVTGLKETDGWIGFQVEVPNGGQFLLRNIQLVEFGYESLFSGHDFTGWEAVDGDADDCWSANEGLLICSGKKGPWLRSKREYDDFNLRLDYQVTKGGNSGVYVRVPLDGNHHRDDANQPAAGFEVQILDDAAPEYAALKDFQYSASIYDFAGASPRVSRPIGDWNTLEINCRGQHVTTWHNGVCVTNVTDAEIPSLGLRSTKGFLGLQNHSTVVTFRNIRVGKANEVPSEPRPHD